MAPARAMRLGRLPGQCGAQCAARWMCTPDMVFGGVFVGMRPGRSSLITLCARCNGRAAEQRPRCLSHASHRWTTSIHGAFFGTGCPCVLLSTIPIAIIRESPSVCV